MKSLKHIKIYHNDLSIMLPLDQVQEAGVGRVVPGQVGEMLEISSGGQES